MKHWWQRHNNGISAFVAGLCFEGMLDCLVRGNYEFALLEFILFAANIWLYTSNYEEPSHG